MARGRKPVDCYVYCIFDGLQAVYVGKGTGSRLSRQMRRFGLPGHVLERFDSEAAAFTRERHWIKVLRPTGNKCPGGNGGTVSHGGLPKALEGVVSEREWLRAKREIEAEMDEIERVGSRRYAARFLLTRLSPDNCEQHGVSKVGLNRLREVAYGPRC